MNSSNILKCWRGLLIILAILLCSLILIADSSQTGRCGFVMAVMVVFWVTEVIPLPVTALIPVFAFPLLGILSTGTVSRLYLKDSNMMFLGGLIMAAAVEDCNLHERIALFVILRVGQSPRLLALGFMIVTSFLSMWISNTATAAMIVSIVDAVVKELTKLREMEVMSKVESHREGRNQKEKEEKEDKDKKEEEEEEVGQVAHNRYLQRGPEGKYVDMHVINEEMEEETQIESVGRQEEKKENIAITKTDATRRELEAVKKECLSLKQMLFLSVAFSANTGGTGSPLGCGPNIVLMGILDSTFTNSMGLNFATWLIFNVPGVLLCAILGWLWLQLLFMYCGKNRVQTSTPARERSLKRFLEGHYRALGPVSRREAVVVVAFVALVMVWVFRDPGFVPGWATYYPMHNDKVSVQSATPVMLIIFLLSCIPASSTPDENSKTVKKCMTWNTVHKKVPWGIVLLLGGGLALSEGAKRSGLSLYFGQQLIGLRHLPIEALQIIVCLLSSGITELASNTATASILLPILANLAMTIQVHPLHLLIPATACCAYAFMLPVATPGNAIILSVSGMSTIDMMRAGVVMNIACVLVTFFLINTLGYAIFDFDTLPTLRNITTV